MARRPSRQSPHPPASGHQTPSAVEEPKPQEKRPPQDLVTVAYRAYVRRRTCEKALQKRLKSLECTSAGMLKLRRTAPSLRKRFNANLQRRNEIIDRATVDGAFQDVGFLLNFAIDKLILHHIRSDRDGALESLRKDVRRFAVLIRDLDSRGVSLTRVFHLVLAGPGIHELMLWDDHRKLYATVAAKAMQFKKRIGSHRDRTRYYTELQPQLLAKIEAEFEGVIRFLDAIIDKRTMAQMDASFARRGGKVRKQPEVWPFLLKKLEQLLIPAYPPSRCWERPGGLSGKAVSSRVYETINQILYFCYPRDWPLNPRTTASIKSRCQRYADRS